ncbi:hypothetical protein NLU13_2254 [Sarocladium strictum]|uniref:Uncharacterized protein n=1 Tax=Sarocladium strictum TaxID=5046 RepID=A0AA39GT91_SARSR|nr:hypothetical protein NLU13_2254 [Sarocladium strictum]
MAPLTFPFQGARRQLTFPPSRHDRLLSNSAAEFVELRAGGELCRRDGAGQGRFVHRQGVVGDARITDTAGSGRQVALDVDHQAPKFVSGLDRFVPAENAPSSAEYYKASSEMIAKFQVTLENFTKTLQSRKVFKTLQIEPRDPASYDLEYVLKVASVVKEHKEGLENTQTIKKFIRRCCKGTSDNSTVLKGFLSMIPTDTYGAVISGGLTLILAAVESHERSRMEIQATLADIPRKLNNIQRVSKAHRKTPELHLCADQVFLSIFVVLERIINKLSMSFIEKGMTKLKGQGDEIKDAIEEFGMKVTEFQEEVDVCAQLRFGRIEEGQNTIIKRLEGLPDRKELEAFVCTLLYRLNTSHPNFNPIDGSTQRLIKPSSNTATSPGQDATLLQDTAKELAAAWISDLGDFDPTSDRHITELLSGLADLSIEERDQLQSIIGSDVVQDWLTPTTSSLLYMHAETPPEELVNALSFSAATLTLTLAGAVDMPVLSFFCGLRRNDSRENSRSGPQAIRKSLNGQLLRFVLDRRSSADLSFLQDETLRRKSKSKSKYAKKLFHEILGALPDNEVVFIVLDSFSRLGGSPGDKDKGDDIIRELAALKSGFPELIIKILVVDAMPSCPVSKLADVTLYVPDEVDGWRNDVNLAVLDQSNRDAISQLMRRQGKEASSAVESSDFSSGSESD